MATSNVISNISLNPATRVAAREITRQINQPTFNVNRQINTTIQTVNRKINDPLTAVRGVVTGTAYNVKRTVNSTLNNTVRNAIKSLNLGLTNSQINTISNQILGPFNKKISEITRTNTNAVLKSLPRINIGIHNPVKLTTGNLNASTLTKTLENELKKQSNPVLVSSLITDFKKALTNNLPKNVNFNNINIDQLIEDNNITTEFSRAISTEVEGELFTYSDDLIKYNTGKIPETVFKGEIDVVYENIDDTEDALSRIQELYSEQQVSQLLGESEKYLDSKEYREENNEKLITLQKGFIDPTANLPNDQYDGVSEVNKLAQGEAAGTVVAKKNYERMRGAKLPGGEAWDQPISPFKGEYPYNKVTQTESGHIFEVDDTPGGERIHNYHRSGTFEEIDNTGSRVTRIVGSDYTIIDRNGKIFIAGKADVSISGNCNIYVGNDANIEVDGDTNLTCHNDITAMAGGKMNLSAVEEINITSNKIFMEAYQNMNIKSNVDINVLVNEVFNLKSNSNINLQTTDLFNLKSGNTLKVQSPTYYSYASDYYVQATNTFHFKGGASFNVDADVVHLNSGTAQSSQQAGMANLALISNIGIMPGRKPEISVVLDDPSPLSIGDKVSLLLDEPVPDTEDGLQAQKDAKDKAILAGHCSIQEYESEPVSVESQTTTTTNSTVVTPDETLRNRIELPGNYKLSEHFTVEMLSSRAAVSSYTITANPSRSITYGDIVFNLQALALNILEPIYKLYPNMIVTSAYRNPKADCNSPTSQHPLGKAADIQFRGLAWDKYYDIAVELSKILNFDQLLLEYCATANNPWIHISFDGSSNRKQIMTFWNHRRHSYALTNLSKNTA